MSLITFNSDLVNVKSKIPGFDAAVGTLFGSAVLSSLLTYLSLSSAERARWLADPANAAMVAQLNRFMAWFAAQKQAATTPLQTGGMALPPAVNAGAMT